MKISVILPVFNEEKTVAEVVGKVAGSLADFEIIAVNDGSTDTTRTVLDSLETPNLTVVHLPENRGKGSALRAATPCLKGGIVVIQDADTEYDPADISRLVSLIASKSATVVYGSRFLHENRFNSLPQKLGNRLLTGVTNLLFKARLTDMETCYKAMPVALWKELHLESKGFEIEPEITAKLLKRGISITEVPISFFGRNKAEGKKITWQDGIRAFITLIKYRFT